MNIRSAIDTHLALQIDDLGPVLVNMLRERFTRENPKWKNAKRRGFYTGPTKQNPQGIERYLRSYEVREPWILLPRGSLGTVRDLLAAEGAWIDKPHDHTVLHDPVRFRMREPLRPYQKRAAMELVKAGGGVLKGPCGSGKTVCLLGAIAEIGQPTLVVVHSKPLMQQWIAAASRFLGVVPGTIGGGRQTVIRSLTVGVQQTIWRRPDAPWWKDFGCLAGDEIHHWAANTFQATTHHCSARWRIGCSADETRKDGLEYMIYESFGPLATEIKRQEVMEAGRLLPTRIEVVPTDFWDEDYQDAIDAQVTPDWNAMLANLNGDEDRNEIIWKRAQQILRDQSARILMLNDRVEACRSWVARFDRAGYTSGLLVGGNDYKDQQADTIDGLRTGRCRVGVGTTVADEGLDIPPLTHVLLTCPVHGHPRRMVQQFGRAARPHGDKEFGTAVYFWDRRMWPRERDTDTHEVRVRREREFLNKLRSICDVLSVDDC